MPCLEAPVLWFQCRQTIMRDRRTDRLSRGYENFQKGYKPSQESRRQKGDTKRVPCWGPGNIRRRTTKSSPPEYIHAGPWAHAFLSHYKTCRNKYTDRPIMLPLCVYFAKSAQGIGSTEPFICTISTFCAHMSKCAKRLLSRTDLWSNVLRNGKLVSLSLSFRFMKRWKDIFIMLKYTRFRHFGRYDVHCNIVHDTINKTGNVRVK
jgi:hypothetical protein